MPIGARLKEKLRMKYGPSSIVHMRFERLDLTFKTNEQGDAMLLFIGERDKMGVIKGERYMRTVISDQDGRTIKDHWERKGKAS